MKFKVGDKVYNAYRQSEFREGVVNDIRDGYILVAYEDAEHLSKASFLILLKDKAKYKYVLKSQLLDDIYPYDQTGYVKVKVIK